MPIITEVMAVTTEVIMAITEVMTEEVEVTVEVAAAATAEVVAEEETVAEDANYHAKPQFFSYFLNNVVNYFQY
ncbi:hypothetical protein J3F82_001694 [Coemansia sp. RSA 637]|nr:hypothetical protein J3F82_001694 [Coemansia sp. RSA 637]